MSRETSSTSATHLRLNPESGRRIRIYRNGDAHHKGITVVLNIRKTHDINAFLDTVSEKIGLVLGAKRLFTLDGMPITSTEQLEHNKAYVASSGPFIPVQYGQSPLQSTPGIARRGSSSVLGNRFARPKEDPFALSSSSKKSAPADLTHSALRQSRSNEPRRAPRSTTMVGQSNVDKQREKSTGDKSRSEASKDKKNSEGKARTKPQEGTSKKRGKKKAKEEPTAESFSPPPPAASPIHVVPDEPAKQEEENEVVEEVEVHDSPIPRTKTEVEVVEHDDRGEEEGAADEGTDENEVLENGGEGKLGIWPFPTKILKLTEAGIEGSTEEKEYESPRTPNEESAERDDDEQKHENGEKTAKEEKEH